jgi:hypothetical protein
MHVYFFSSLQSRLDHRQTNAHILAALRQTDVWVSSNVATEEIQVSDEVHEAAQASDTPLMDQMNAFIIEGTHAAPEVGFLMAHALATKKPTLYLYQRGTVPDIFTHVNRQGLPKYITVVPYQPEHVPSAVMEFLGSVAGQVVKEVPRLKFTLRLTGSQDDYLDYKTHNTKTTKADFLRDHVERLMVDDVAWQAWKKKRRDQEK